MKKSNVMALLTILLFAVLSFVSCSKDEHKDDKDTDYSKLVIGVWQSDIHSPSSHFLKINKDGSGEELTVTFSGSSVSDYQMDDFTWKVNTNTLEIIKGSDINYYYFTLNEDNDHMDLEWKGDLEGFSRISNVSYDNVLSDLPIDLDIVGSWKGSESGGTSFFYNKFYKDGTCLRYYFNTSSGNFNIVGYNWGTKDDIFTFTLPNSTSKWDYKYSLNEDKSNLILNDGDDHIWLRVNDSEYNSHMPDPVEHIKGAWADKTGWNKITGTFYTRTYLYFYDDGTFRTIDLRSHDSGKNVHEHFTRLGYYKFEGSCFTYTIDNGASKGNTLYAIYPKELVFRNPDGFLGVGNNPDLQKVDDSVVEPYLE